MLLFANSKAQSPDQVLQVADELFAKKDYYGSIGFYENAMKIDSNNADVLYKYGRNLYLINNPKKASRYLLKAELLGGADIYPNLHFELAESYRKSEDFRKARRYYNRAIRPYRRDRKSLEYREINQAKESASWASKQNETDNTIENLGPTVNKDGSEFAPYLFNDKLYFSALVADSSLQNYQIADTDYQSRIYSKFYPSEDQANRIYFESKYEEQFSKFDIANISISTKDEAYFSVCDSLGFCEIWTAELNGKLFMNPKKLNKNINYPGSNNTMPEIVDVADNRYLFFVSNRDKGFGGLDIWYAKLENFGFDEAKNLGGTINTPGDEISPRYQSQEEALYFSSNWHLGFGGFDIFKSSGFPPIMKDVENLKKPINSSLDDLYFTPAEAFAYFSSNRNENNTSGNNTCCSDIYKTDYSLTLKEETPELEIDTLKQQVSIELLNKYLPLDLYFHNDIPKPSLNDSTTKANYLNIAYEYLDLEPSYLDQWEGYVQDEEVDLIDNFFNEKIQQGIEDLERFTPLLLSELEKGSEISLIIKGYASALSQSDYNLKLTLRRIESLINYLKSYKNGVFIPYLDDVADNGGKLKIKKLPYGDFTTAQSKENNQSTKESIYSLAAMSQRKIELLAITKSNEGYKRLDDQSDFQEAKVSLNKTSYTVKVKKGQSTKRIFLLKNDSGKELEIYNITSSSDQLKIKFPSSLKPKEDGKIEFEISTDDLVVGKYLFNSYLVSNANRNLIELKLEVEVTP